MFKTLDDEWLFAEAVAERLRRFTGVELQAEDARTGRSLPWFQALAEYELPPMHPDTTGLKPNVGCKHCRRDGFFHKGNQPLLIAYDELDVGQVPDIAHTYEHSGWSGLRDPIEESHFAAPLFVVKPPVLQALRDANVHHLQSYPVTVR